MIKLVRPLPRNTFFTSLRPVTLSATLNQPPSVRRFSPVNAVAVRMVKVFPVATLARSVYFFDL